MHTSAIGAEATKWGEEMGRIFKSSFESQVQDLKIAVDLNDTMAKVKLDELKFDEARVGDVNVDVNVDGAAGAVAELGAVKLAADNASGSGGGGGLGGLISSAGLGLPKMAALGLAAAVLAPALIAIAAAAAGAMLGLVGMFTAAAAGAGAFGLAALPVFTSVSVALVKIAADQLAASTAISAAAKSTALAKLNADLASLNPTVSTVVLGILGLKKSFMNWDKQFDPGILKVFSAALADVMPALRPLTPLVNAGALGLTAFFKALGLGVASPAYSKFIDWLAKATGPAMSTLTTVFGNLASGFASMLENSGPLVPMVEKALTAMSDAFDRWAKSKAFKDFVAYAVANLPLVAKLLEQIASFAIWALGILAPFGLMILREVEAVITIFAGLPGNIKNALGNIAAVIEAPFIAAFNTIVSAYNATLGHIFGDMHYINVQVNYKQGSGSPPVSGGAGGAGIRGFASGTDQGMISGLALVGERGPELVNFGSPAQIIPNSALTVGSNGNLAGRLDQVIALLTASPSRTGAAISTSVGATLGNAIDRHAKTTLMLSRTGA